MFPEHVERSFLDPEYSFDEYFQLGSRRNIRPVKNGLYAVDGFVRNVEIKLVEFSSETEFRVKLCMHARSLLWLNREKGYMKAVADLMHRLTISRTVSELCRKRRRSLHTVPLPVTCPLCRLSVT